MPTNRRDELRSILSIAAPLAITQVSQLIMNLAASFMLGRISGPALAAGGLCAVFIQAISVVSQGVISGSHPLMAAAIGKSELSSGAEDEVAFAFGGGIVWAFICSVIGVVILLSLPNFLHLFSVPPDVLAGVRNFIVYAAWALPAILWIAPLRFYFSVSGKAWLVMAAIGLGALFYIAMLCTLVFGYMGMPALGVGGAGIAFTTAWWSIALGLTAFCIWRCYLPRAMLRLEFRKWLRAARDVWGVGWPIGLIYAGEFGLTITMTLMVTSFGTVAIVAHQIVNSLNNIAFNPIVALGQAATVRVAYHLGGNRPNSARMAGNLSLVATFLIMALFGLILLFTSGTVTELFLDPGVASYTDIQITTHSLILILVAFLIFDGLQGVSNGCLRGMKDTRVPLIIGLSGFWLIGMPTAAVLAFGFNFGVVGIWFGILSGITSVAIMLLWRWHKGSMLAQASGKWGNG
ncbi:MATE family efflux transporter [Agrobacterium sp. ES01]|uniref:MATE family efflux transporter n=1 Tax=Agrobacterium sp. ES01 TaxID=3420714 RepID=UPI003D110FAC